MLDTAPAERDRVLEASTRGDTELAGRVMRLVTAYESSGGDAFARPAILPPEVETHPIRVGRYTIQSVLAEGGVSIVYHARQHQPSRSIALKVIRPSFASPGTLGRFTLEGEVLGRLQHPGISHVYDAGDATAEFADGHTERRAFLAMELVKGLTLATAARERSMSIRERIAIMADVCDAVQAAHQQGVIHRDLKPANIVVDAEGRPKVLDFGAACFSADMVSAAASAGMNAFVGTGPYLIPEHASSDPRQIDTRSDVYSLGVILYELLSERAPIDVSGVPIQEAARRVLTVTPTPLGEIDPRLGGDLSLVIGMAIAKDKAERYQSAAEFSADLRRFLRREPVTARAPSAMYELRMLARRRKQLVAASAFAAIALLATTYAAIHAASTARSEARQKATALEQVTTARDEAEAAATFLEDTLLAANPEEIGRDVRLRELLDEAVRTLDAKFKGMPASEARAREAIGRTYFGLGDLKAAHPLLERAYALRRESLGDDDPITARCGMALAAVVGVMGDAERSASLYSGSLATFRRLRPRGHKDILAAMSGLASVEKDRQHFAAALDLYREAIALAKERGDGLTAGDLSMMVAAAETLRWVGQRDAAASAYEEVIPLMRARIGPDHPWTLSAECGAASVALSLGRTADAERVLRRVLEARTRVLGPEHGDTLGAMNDLANVLVSTGRHAEAEELYGQVITVAERVLGPTHRNTLKSRFNLAQAACMSGKLNEASDLLTGTLALQRRVLGPRHVDIADSLRILATINARLDRPQIAAEQFGEAIEMLSALISPEHQVVLRMRCERGECLTRLSRFAEAEAELRLAVDGLLAAGAPVTPHARLAVERLAACQEARGGAEDAARTRARIEVNGVEPPTGR